MNDLQKYIEESWSDEVKTMNDLHERGVISDNAILAKDVCNEDAKRAVEFLNDNTGKG
jgi:hypothetical protein